MFCKISEGVKKLGQHMIDNPQDWEQTTYTFKNKTNPDIKLWTANGWPFLQLNGNNAFNFREKRYLNNCIKKSLANKLYMVATQ